MLVKNILILLLLNILFIGCGSGGSSSSSVNSDNISPNDTPSTQTKVQDNTKLAFTIPFIQGENSPLKQINHIND